MINERKVNVPICEKVTLSVKEAAAYSGIGEGKIRDLSNSENCKFVVWVGSKRMIKRKAFDKFIDESYSI